MNNALERLAAAAKAKKLTVFVGAGMSTVSPTNAPGWFELRDLILEEMARFLINDMFSYQDVVRSLLDDLRASTIRPEIILEAIDRFGGMSSVIDFARPLNDGIPNPAHYALASLVREGLVSHIITSNWDTYLERALGGDHPLTLKSPPSDLSDLPNGARALLHVHGSLEGRAFVQAGHYRLGVAPEASRMLAKILDSTQCLFLGYSGNDYDIFPLLRQSMEQSRTVFYWLVKPGVAPGENLRRLLEDFPNRAFLICDELTALLASLGGVLRVSVINEACRDGAAGNDAAQPVAGGLATATEKFGHVFSYLTLAMAAAATGRWDSAKWLCEFATDAVYSLRLYPGESPHWLAAEAYRFAAVCAACQKNINEAHHLIGLSEHEAHQAHNGGYDRVKARQAKEISFGFVLLCANHFDEAEAHFMNVLNGIRATKHFFGMKQWPMLNASAVTGYVVSLAAVENDIDVTLECCSQVYLENVRIRNVWSQCCNLLVLGLCYFRKSMLEDAAEAMNDCRLLAEASGLEEIASAAMANLASFKAPPRGRIEPIGPIQSRQTGWNLSVDPFGLLVFGADETAP
jgi:SIR2-like domain